MTREMKDSGIEWIGQIPKEWHTARLKWLSSIKTGTTPSRNNYDIFYCLEDGTKWIKAEDLGKNTDITKTEEYLTKQGTKAGRIFPKNSVYVCCIASVGKTGFCTSPSSCNQQINVLQFENAYWKYGYYLTIAQENEYLIQASGNVVKILNTERQKNIICPVPSLCEQNKIANYLDSKCSQIDSILTGLQDQIDTLEQYKKSVITEAVTKGLSPDAEMKDSKVEWIGEIPSHWTISKLKYFFYTKKGLSITKENLIDEGLPVISYGQIHSKENSMVDIKQSLLRFVDNKYSQLFPNSEVKKGDFVFADTSEDYDGCGNCVYKRDDNILFAGYHTIILRSLLIQDNRYFAYLFKTNLWRKQIREIASGVKLFSITKSALLNSLIIIPTKHEQKEIADYLDTKCSQIDSIISQKKEQMETLKEYKKSLIYEYVTGKKEMPNA